MERIAIKGNKRCEGENHLEQKYMDWCQLHLSGKYLAKCFLWRLAFIICHVSYICCVAEKKKKILRKKLQRKTREMDAKSRFCWIGIFFCGIRSEEHFCFSQDREFATFVDYLLRA